MFQVRTVVHYVHNSPVNGTHVTRGIKNSLTQNVKKKKKILSIVLLVLLCHTLATSLTSRVTRCSKLGPLCPLHTLCTQKSQTKCDSGSFHPRTTVASSSGFPSPGNQGTNTMWSTRGRFGHSSPNNISNES